MSSKRVSKVVLQSFTPDASESGYMRVSEGERVVVMEDDDAQDFIVGIKPSTGEKGRVPRSMLGRTSMTDDGPRVVSSPTTKTAKKPEVQNSVPFSSPQPSTPTSAASPASPESPPEPQLAKHVSKEDRPTRVVESKSSGEYGHRDSFTDSDGLVGSPNMHRAMTLRRGTAWSPASALTGDEPLNNAVEMCVREWTKKWTHALIQGRVSEYQKLKNQVYTVLEWKRQLAQITEPAKNAYIRGNLIKFIEARRELDESFAIPRTADGDPANESNCSIHQLHALHRAMQARMLEGTVIPHGVQAQYAHEEFSGVREKNNKVFSDVPVHLFMDMKMAMFSAGEPCKLFFSLYAREENSNALRVISEEFCVALTAHGMPEDNALIEKLYTTFTDLTREELASEIYLVCRIFRYGKILEEEGKKKTPPARGGANAGPDFKRPFGCGVLNLSEINVQSLEAGKEFSPPLMNIYRLPLDKDAMFPVLHEMLVNKEMAEVEVVPRSNGIVLSLALLEGKLAKLDREIHADQRLFQTMCSAPRTQRVVPPKQPDHDFNPHDVRNDLYITLTSSAFSQDRKTSAKNIELRVICLNSAGQRVNCLLAGTGRQVAPTSEYRSSVLYHVNNPGHGDTIKVAISPDDGAFEDLHLLFLASHCSTGGGLSLFSFGFLPLADRQLGGKAIQNGPHIIPFNNPLPGLDKLDGPTISVAYLNDPNLKQRQIKSFNMATAQEHLVVTASLNSTTKTEHQDLHNLIQWQRLSDDQLRRTLKNCSALVTEVKQYLRVFLDSVTTIFVERPQLADNCFELLCVVLQHFGSALLKAHRGRLQQYIDELFYGPKLHPILLRSLQHVFTGLDEHSGEERVKIPPKQNVKNAITSLPFLINFVQVSRTQETASGQCENTDQTVKANLLVALARVNQIMATDEASWKTIKGKCLQNFYAVFEHVSFIFSVTERAQIARDFLAPLPVDEQKEAKLTLVRELVNNEVFMDTDARAILLPTIVETLCKHMRHTKEEEAQCILISKDLLEILSDIANENDIFTVRPLIHPTVDVCLAIAVRIENGGTHMPSMKSTELDAHSLLADCTVNLCSLFTLVQEDGFADLLRNLQSEGDAKILVFTILRTFNQLLSTKPFPNVWLLMHMVVNSLCTHLLSWIGKLLCSHFARDFSSFHFAVEGEEEDDDDDDADARTIVQVKDITDKQVWAAFLELALAFMMQRELDLGHPSMSAAKREFITNNYSDLREEVAEVMEKCWAELEHVRITLVDQLVQPLLELVTSTHPKIAEMGRAMYIDLLRADYATNGDFKRAGRYTIDSVDAIVNEETRGSSNANRHGNRNALLELFNVTLEQEFAKDSVLNTKDAFEFAGEIKQLFKLLRALAQYSLSAEEERCYAYGRLMDFLLKMKREDSYVKYAHNLSREMNTLGLHAEAANALLLHANLHDWSNTQLNELELGENDMPLPPSTSWERKEMLYQKAITLYEHGNYYEGCIELLDQLREHYQKRVFDYAKLSDVLSRMSKYYDSIRLSERFYPTMFRVGYYGDFPEEIKNKEFIYKGNNLEGIMEFTGRIQLKYNNKPEILPPKVVPGEEHMNSDRQFLQITKVTPAYLEEMTGDPMPDIAAMPPYVRNFKANNQVCCFFYQRPFRKKTEKSSNEFLDLWIEKRYMRTAEVFPHTSRRSQVIADKIVILNPIENAYLSLAERNADLLEKIAQMRLIPDGTAPQSFTMAVSGTVDAAVNGGTKNYESFITGAYRVANPEIAEDIDANPQKANVTELLKASMREQLDILEQGIAVHAVKCSEALQPLHSHIATTFIKMRHETLELLGSK